MAHDSFHYCNGGHGCAGRDCACPCHFQTRRRRPARPPREQMVGLLSAAALYLGDNGACYCGVHHGATAQMTGKDLHGTPLVLVTADLVRKAGYDPDAFACEACGRRLTGYHCAAPACPGRPYKASAEPHRGCAR